MSHFSRADDDRLSAEADAHQDDADRHYMHGVRMANLRTRYPTGETDPDSEGDSDTVIAMLRTLIPSAGPDRTREVAEHAIAHVIGLRNQMSYAYPLAERFCRMVLESESIKTGDGWRYWQHVSETDQDAGHVLDFMSACGLIELHDSVPLGWRWVEGARR